MNNLTQSPKQVLPEGLSIQTKIVFRKYCNRRKYTFGDDTLGGLYRKGSPAPETNGPVVTRNIGEPDDATRLKISQATRGLPEKLKLSGLTVIEEQKEMFLERANALKAKLCRRESTISAEELQRLDDDVNSYACEGYEVVVFAFRVTSDRLNAGSRKRSDGKFVTRTVLRRVLVKEKPTIDLVEAITDSICSGNVEPNKESTPRSYKFQSVSELMKHTGSLKTRARGSLVPDRSGTSSQPVTKSQVDRGRPNDGDPLDLLQREADRLT